MLSARSRKPMVRSVPTGPWPLEALKRRSGRLGEALLAEPARQLGGWHRTRQVVALGLVAAPLAQGVPRCLILDALGDHAQAKAACELHERPHDHLVGGVD